MKKNRGTLYYQNKLRLSLAKKKIKFFEEKSAISLIGDILKEIEEVGQNKKNKDEIVEQQIFQEIKSEQI